MRADWSLRAVAVKAGIHEVVFNFAPRSFFWGGVISIVALILGAVGIVWWSRGEKVFQRRVRNEV